MELPKNVTQIGTPDKNHKVFIEDYVISYVKQIMREGNAANVRIILFGNSKMEGETEYLFAYGASVLEGVYKGEDYLTEREKDIIEHTRKQFFKEHLLLGWLMVEEDLPEGVFLYKGEKAKYIQGYSYFYEKNDCMLNFMVHNQEEKEKKEKKEQQKPTEKAETIWRPKGAQKQTVLPEKQTEKKAEKKGEEFRGIGGLGMTIAAMLVVLSLIGIANGKGTDEMTALQKAAEYVMNQMGEKHLPDREGEAIPTQSGQIEPMTKTEGAPEVVLENSIVEALQQENNMDKASEGDMSSKEDSPSKENIPDQEEESSSKTETQDSDKKDISEMQKPEQEETPVSKETDAEETIAVEEPVTEKTTVPQPMEYLIKKGDTLLGISQKQYGNSNKVQAICDLNHIDNPDNIQIGQKILLP